MDKRLTLLRGSLKCPNCRENSHSRWVSKNWRWKKHSNSYVESLHYHSCRKTILLLLDGPGEAHYMIRTRVAKIHPSIARTY